MSAFLRKYCFSLGWALATFFICFRDAISVWHAMRPSTFELVEDVVFLAVTLITFAAEKSKKA